MTAYARKFAFSLTASLLLAGFSASANATYIEWSWTHVYDPVDLIVPPSHSYTHDIGSEGFRPLTDFVERFQLSIDLYGSDDEGEAAFISVPTSFSIGDPWSDNWYWTLSGIAGWLSLNLTGQLDVTVSSASVYGDFMFGSSTLTASGYRQVPEPGTLALLAIGLIGMGVALTWARRRSRNNNKD